MARRYRRRRYRSLNRGGNPIGLRLRRRIRLTRIRKPRGFFRIRKPKRRFYTVRR